MTVIVWKIIDARKGEKSNESVIQMNIDARKGGKGPKSVIQINYYYFTYPCLSKSHEY